MEQDSDFKVKVKERLIIRSTMTKLFNYIFRQTKIGKLTNDYKRIIGFLLYAAGVIGNLLLVAAESFFPDYAGTLGPLGVLLVDSAAQAANFLETLGVTVTVVGVADAAVKEKA